MYYNDLQSYISALELEDDLVRVYSEVDPYLEVAGIVDRVSKGKCNKRALFFENVKDSKLPLVSNLFGTRQRVAKALGVSDVAEIAKRLSKDLSEYKDFSSVDALNLIVSQKTKRLITDESETQLYVDVTKDGFDVLPALQSWPEDGGCYLTLAQSFTLDPETKQQNCGMYRIQILDNHTALIRCKEGSGCADNLLAWSKINESMPIAFVLGGPPVLTVSAGIPLPKGLSEIDYASYLVDENIKSYRSKLTGLILPTSAEIVIEGFVSIKDYKLEGPFANHTGYYANKSKAPIVSVCKILMRNKAVYPCTIVGPPPTENNCLGEAVVSLLLTLLQHDYPWVIDVCVPLEGVFHRGTVVQVENKNDSLEEISRKLWSSALLNNSKLIVLVDVGCDLGDFSKIYWHIINSETWQNSVIVDADKMAIDTRVSRSRKRVQPDSEVKDRILRRWKEYGLGEN